MYISHLLHSFPLLGSQSYSMIKTLFSLYSEINNILATSPLYQAGLFSLFDLISYRSISLPSFVHIFEYTLRVLQPSIYEESWSNASYVLFYTTSRFHSYSFLLHAYASRSSTQQGKNGECSSLATSHRDSINTTYIMRDKPSDTQEWTHNNNPNEKNSPISCVDLLEQVKSQLLAHYDFDEFKSAYEQLYSLAKDCNHDQL